MKTLGDIVEGAQWLAMVLDGLESDAEIYYTDPYWVAKRPLDRINEGADPYRSFHDCVKDRNIARVKSLWDRSDGMEVVSQVDYFRFPKTILTADSWFDKAYALAALNPCIEAVAYYFKDEPYWLCCLPSGKASGVMDYEYALKLDEAKLNDRAHISDVLTLSKVIYPRSLLMTWSESVIETPVKPLPKLEPVKFELPAEYTHGSSGVTKAERDALHKEFARRSLYGLPDMLPIRK